MLAVRKASYKNKNVYFEARILIGWMVLVQFIR